jgi:DNA-binding transcriptional LysR family regulator
MQLEKFKIFADLVEAKSFSDAAKLNGITQAAVSQQVRVMERHFKTLLIDRSQKRFQMTREGMRVYDAAKAVVQQYEKLVSELEEMNKVISGTIRIATISSIGLYELPPYIDKLRQDYPAVNVQVEYRRSSLVYEDILRNSVDFGFVAFPVRMRQIEVIPFRSEHYALITHPSHPLASGGDVPLPALSRQKFISSEPDGPSHNAVYQFLGENKIEVELAMKFDNVETVKRAVEMNAGVAIVPEPTVLQEVKQGSLVAKRFKDKEFIRPLGILHRKGRVFMPAMKKFIETLVTDLPI